MAIIKQGSTTLNAGAKGDKGEDGAGGIVSIVEGANITVDATDPANPIVSSSGVGGSSNANVFIPTLLTDFTSPNVVNANKIWQLQEDFDLAGASFTPPSNITIECAGGSLLNIGSFVGDNTQFIHHVTDGGLGIIDLFSATMTGTFKVGKIYSLNYGAIDDNLETTDNFDVGFNMLYIVNQSSGHLVWNRKDTGKYWARVGYPYFYDSPFYPISNETMWIVGKGYDDVTVEHEGTEIISITNSFIGSKRYVFYDTSRSTIKGGLLRGDRYRHFYDQSLVVYDFPVAVSGNINLVVREVDDRISFNTLKTITGSIPVLIGDTGAEVQTKIANFINTDAAFADYSATTSTGLTDTNRHNESIRYNGTITPSYEVVIRGAGGSDYEMDFDAGTSDAEVGLYWSPFEWGHGICYGSGAYNCIIKDIHLTEYHGDGIDTQWQGNGTDGILLANLTNGNIGSDGVIDNGDTDYYYLTDTRLMPQEISPKRPLWFGLAPNSMSPNILKHNNYRMVYYDENDNWLETSPLLIPYEKYIPRKDVKRYRILVENVGATDMASFNYFVNSIAIATGAIMDNIEVSFTRRQGISNPPMDFILSNSKIHDVGGQEPQFGIDLEDNTKHSRSWLIDRCEFWNNANGDIILKGATHGTISNCMFKQNSFNLRAGVDDFGLAIGSGYSREIKIFGNNFEYKDVDLDIGTQFFSNHFETGAINCRYGNVNIYNNMLVNVNVNGGTKIGEPNSQSAGGNSINYLNNNIRVFNKGWGNARLDDDFNCFVKNNNIFVFNDRNTNQKALSDDTIRDIYVQSTTDSYIKADRTLLDAIEYKGSTKNEKVSGLLTNDSNRAQVYYAKYVSEIDDLNVDFPLSIEAGVATDFTVKNTIATKLRVRLDQFTNTNTTPFKTATFKDCSFSCPPRTSTTVGWLKNAASGNTNFVTVYEDKDVDIVFDKVKFISEDETVGLFMYIGNRGTTIFKDCIFSHPLGETVNFNTNGARSVIGTYATANTGAITFIDCSFDNITITPRTGVDKVLYTKAHPNLQVFADNTTAIAGGIPTGYMYRTATGEVRMVYTP